VVSLYVNWSFISQVVGRSENRVKRLSTHIFYLGGVFATLVTTFSAENVYRHLGVIPPAQSASSKCTDLYPLKNSISWLYLVSRVTCLLVSVDKWP
jgi:hypothetical protein